jgi:acyl-CoA thioester hydrolase
MELPIGPSICMTEFTYEVPMDVRYRDLDPQGHVNNAVCATYLEHARVSYFTEVLDVAPDDPSEIGIVVANLEMDYNRPIEFRAPVTVAMRMTEMGESSIRTAYEIRADGVIAVTAETVMVAVDPAGTPKAIPEAVREQIAEFEDL